MKSGTTATTHCHLPPKETKSLPNRKETHTKCSQKLIPRSPKTNENGNFK